MSPAAPLAQHLARVLGDALDLVLPQTCAGCRQPGPAVCATCRAALDGERPRRVRPDPCPPGLPRTAAAAGYGPVVRGLLVGHKERGRLGLVSPLGALLAGAVLDLRAGPVVLVPVPSSRTAVRRRGHDHALRLARAAAAGSGDRAAPLLRAVRRVADQAGLDPAERAANLAGALAARRPLDGLAVVVVDDVVTTGATLVEAARALREGGARVLGAAVVAAVARHPGGTGATSVGVVLPPPAVAGGVGPPSREGADGVSLTPRAGADGVSLTPRAGAGGVGLAPREGAGGVGLTPRPGATGRGSGGPAGRGPPRAAAGSAGRPGRNRATAGGPGGTGVCGRPMRVYRPSTHRRGACRRP